MRWILPGVLALSLGGLTWAQSQEGNAGGFEIDDCGTLFSGTGPNNTPICTTDLACTPIPAGDDWAQGPALNGVLDGNGQPTINPNTLSPYRALLRVDQNWGNRGDGFDPTQFGGVSNKNNDPIGDPLLDPTQRPWDWNGSGGGPQKNDITNTYVHSRVDPVTGHRWLIVAAESRATNGDSPIDFEFNLAGLELCDSTLTQCGGPGGEPVAGVTKGKIIGLGPHAGRTADIDFIISVNYVQGGAVPQASVRVWTETSPSVYEYVLIQDLGVDVTGKIFASANICPVVHNSGGTWTHFAGNGAPTPTMLALQMTEAAIDLTGLNINVDPCAVSATLIAKTRSSQSFTAELKDFSLVSFPLAPQPECEITGPVLACPGEESITYTVSEITGINGATYSWGIVGNATFRGGGLTATGDTVCVDAANVCDGSFMLIVTVTAGPCHNSCLFMVNVDDDIPPLITCPPDATYECDAVPADLGSATATDNCDPNVDIAVVEAIIPGNCLQAYTIERTFTATDDCGNSASCTQVITVEDTTPPVIVCPSNASVACTETLHIIVSSTDNCDTSPTVAATFDSANPGVYSVQMVGNGHYTLTFTSPTSVTVTLVAGDACGNQGEPCSFTVTATCFQACSPGYWRQPQHFDSWCEAGYQPLDNFCGPGAATRFVDAFNITDFSSSQIPSYFDPNVALLLTALQTTGGNFNQACFLGSAALLNAAHPDVGAGAAVAEVQEMMRKAFAGEITFGEAKNYFAALIAQEKDGGCPLN